MTMQHGYVRRPLLFYSLFLVNIVGFLVRPAVCIMYEDAYSTLVIPDPGCECIPDVSAFLNETVPEWMDMALPEDMCPGWTDLSTNGKCLPISYGQGSCEAWDNATTQGTGSVSEDCEMVQTPLSTRDLSKEWCLHEWCYVDSRKCTTRPSQPPLYKLRNREVPAGSFLHYSYQTCGYSDKFERQAQVKKSLEGITLRVTAPVVSNPTVNFYQGHGLEWKGPVWDMVQTLARENKFSLQVVNLTLQSYWNAPLQSPWWACLHMLTINATDLCVGDFWADSMRRAFLAPHATFSSPFSEANFLFITELKETVPKPIWKFSNPLRPFTWKLWWCVAVAMCVAAGAYHVAETVAAWRREQLQVVEVVSRDTMQRSDSRKLVEAGVVAKGPALSHSRSSVLVAPSSGRYMRTLSVGVPEHLDQGSFPQHVQVESDMEGPEPFPDALGKCASGDAAMSMSMAAEAEAEAPAGSQKLPLAHPLVESATSRGHNGHSHIHHQHSVPMMQEARPKPLSVVDIWGWTANDKGYRPRFLQRHERLVGMNQADTSAVTFVDSLFIVLRVWTGGYNTPRSHGGRVVTVAFGAFLFVLLQYWRSLVTTGLIVETSLETTGSMGLQEATVKQEMVCSQGYLLTQLAAGTAEASPMNPWNREKVRSIMVDGDHRGPFGENITGSLEAMDAGYCTHVVSDLDQFSYQLATTGTDHCKKGAVGSSVIAPYEIALPLRRDLEPAMSFLIADYYPTYVRKVQEALEVFGLMCDPIVANRVSEATSHLPQYQVENLTSELTILLLGSIVGIVVSYFFPGLPESMR